jgi:murein DD-endopeptidase MepM/ murein hydrolase activator NlpD
MTASVCARHRSLRRLFGLPLVAAAVLVLGCTSPPSSSTEERAFTSSKSLLPEGEAFREPLGCVQSYITAATYTDGRNHKYWPAYGDESYAIDFQLNPNFRDGGATVGAVAAGRVVAMRQRFIWGEANSFGNAVLLEHRFSEGGPVYHSLYAHLDSFDPELGEGDWVEAGTRLGRMGQTGAGAGDPRPINHLHFTLWRDATVHYDVNGVPTTVSGAVAVKPEPMGGMGGEGRPFLSAGNAR